MIALPNNLTSSDDVPNELVTAVVEHWRNHVRDQMGRECEELVDCQPWLYVEAMQYLMESLLTTLGVRAPSAVSFSFMSSITYENECEVLIVWNEGSARYLDPYLVESPCSAIRLLGYPWPAMIEFLTDAGVRSSAIKWWAWLMSAAVDDMPKGRL